MGKKIKAKNIDSEMTTDIELSQAIASKQDMLGFTPENVANKNQPSGYAGLDSSGKVLPSLLPTSSESASVVEVYPLPNNQNTLTNINTFILSNTYPYQKFEYVIFRKTDTTTLVQAGQLRFLFNSTIGQWSISDDYLGQNAGVDFSIDSTGQVKYTSTNMVGTNYNASLKISLIKKIGS